MNPNAFPVRWLCWAIRNPARTVVVVAQSWFDARAEGAVKLGLAFEFVDARMEVEA